MNEIKNKIQELVKYCTDNEELCLVVTVPKFEVGDGDVEQKICSNADKLENDLVLLGTAATLIKNHYGLSDEVLIGVLAEALNFFAHDNKNVH